jgi:hypothetical protein
MADPGDRDDAGVTMVTDEDIATRPLGGDAPRAATDDADSTDTGDDTGDDSGDTTDTSDTGDDSGDDAA